MGTNGITYLGIDGGGTRCRSRIEDENGRLLGEASSRPATTRICLDKAWRSIMEATEAAAAEVGLAREDFARIHVGIGLTALGRRGAQAALNEVSHPFASVRRGIDRLSLVGGLADAITPSLTPDLRARVRRPDADAAARALLMARGRLDLPKRETT